MGEVPSAGIAEISANPERVEFGLLRMRLAHETNMGEETFESSAMRSPFTMYVRQPHTHGSFSSNSDALSLMPGNRRVQHPDAK